MMSFRKKEALDSYEPEYEAELEDQGINLSDGTHTYKKATPAEVSRIANADDGGYGISHFFCVAGAWVFMIFLAFMVVISVSAGTVAGSAEHFTQHTYTGHQVERFVGKNNVNRGIGTLKVISADTTNH